MEIAEKRFNKRTGEKMNIYFIADVHEGNINHGKKEFKKAVEIIKNDPDGYWIGGGDYLDLITTDDRKRFDPTTIDPSYSVEDLADLPYQQAMRFVNNVLPIKDKCLGLGIGNHEQTLMKYKYQDIMQRIGDELEAPLLDYVWMYKLVFGRSDKKIRCTLQIGGNHGAGGGGRREGYPLNKVHDLFRWWDTDVNVAFHIHPSMLFDSKKILSIDQFGNLKKKRRHYAIGGCFLWTFMQGNRNYFESKGNNESDIGMLKLKITVKNDHCDVGFESVILG